MKFITMVPLISGCRSYTTEMMGGRKNRANNQHTSAAINTLTGARTWIVSAVLHEVRPIAGGLSRFLRRQTLMALGRVTYSDTKENGV